MKRPLVVALFLLCLIPLLAQEKPKDKPAPLTTKLADLGKQLRSGIATQRIKATKEIAKLKGEARPLAGPLCDAILDPSTQVAQGAFDALKEVRPELHQSLYVLLKETDAELAEVKAPKVMVSSSSNNALFQQAMQSMASQRNKAMEEKAKKDARIPTKHSRAIRQLGTLEDVKSTVPLLLAYLKKVYTADSKLLQSRTLMIMEAGLETLVQIAPDDARVKQFLFNSAGTTCPEKRLRACALANLARLAVVRKEVRQQTLRQVIAAVNDADLQFVGLKAVAVLGKECKILVPGLKKMADKASDTKLKNAVVEALEYVDASVVGGVTVPIPIKPLPPELNRRVQEAMAWLVMQQNADGSFRCPYNNMEGNVANTAICGLCLLANGPQYQSQIDRAVEYVEAHLAASPEADWVKSKFRLENWRLALGGYFICEYYANLKRQQPKLRLSRFESLLSRLVEDILKRMEPSGGWAHFPRVTNDLKYCELEIMSNWMLTTLGAAQRLGIKVDPAKLKHAIDYVKKCAMKDGGIAYSAVNRWACPCRTGGAINALAMLDRKDHPLYPRMAGYWKKAMAGSASGHGSIAIGLLGSALAARQMDEKHWNEFREKFFQVILASGNSDGSFNTLTSTARTATADSDNNGGLVFITSINLLILQLDRGGLAFMGQPLDKGKSENKPKEETKGAS